MLASIAFEKSLLWVKTKKKFFWSYKSGGVDMNCLNRFETLVKMPWG